MKFTLNPQKMKLVDTSIFISHFRQHDATETQFYELRRKKLRLVISVVTEYEILAGVRPETETYWSRILSNCLILPLDRKTAKIAAKIQQNLRKKHLKIDVQDVFIAATAILHGLEIVTLNKRHFSLIDGLQIFDKQT